MRIKILMTILIISKVCFAQEQIDFKYSRDYKNILALTKVDTSAIYYESLFQRFLKTDTTLTNYEILALQIGYTDNENYWPYQDIELEREIWDLNGNGKYQEALLKCDTLLAKNPFNVLANREKGYSYHKLAKEDSASIYITRFDMIVTSDLSTGDGKSYETSWFVISPADGQWIIKLAFQESICYMGSGRDSDENFHDILGLTLNAEDIKKKKKKKNKEDDCLHLYFNIEHAANRMFGREGMKIFEDKD